MMIEVVEEMEEVRMVPRARPRVPKFSEVWLAEVDISHVAVLKTTELYIIASEIFNFSAFLQIIMKCYSLRVPSCIEGDDKFPWFKSV